MACNCKQDYDRMSKYSDGTGEIETSLWEKLENIIANLLTYIIVISIILVCVIPFTFYIIVCYVLGKPIVIKIPKKK